MNALIQHHVVLMVGVLTYQEHTAVTVTVATHYGVDIVYVSNVHTYNSNFDSIFTEIHSCSRNNGGCDHKCTDRVSGPVCSCSSGYQLQSDKKSCRGQ